MFEGEPEEPTLEEVQLKELHAQWVDLHVATKKNLLEFERPDFRLPSKAKGHEDVKKLVSQTFSLLTRGTDDLVHSYPN